LRPRERVGSLANVSTGLTALGSTTARYEAVPARSNRVAERVKRLGDLAMVLLLLPLVLPLCLVIALAILTDSPGPIFFRAPRVGRGGRPFLMLKFRKMRHDVAGSTLTVANDERFTPIGRFLARSRLDELPQFWNVLRGQMRLVGPRPEQSSFVDSYPREYEEVLSVHPGITGPSQLQNFNEAVLLEAHEDPVRHYVEELLPLKLEIDVRYAHEWTLRKDLKLLLSTFVLPLRVFAMKLRAAAALHLPHGAWAVLPVLVAATVALLAFTLVGGPAR
jgi:lipopolysaccharide/colanic/teichoic acid biosynthesis glycosyltransferase